MKYLNALLARAKPNTRTREIVPDSHQTSTDKTDISPESEPQNAFVGSVGGVQAHSPPSTLDDLKNQSPEIDSEFEAPILPGYESEAFEERAAIMEYDGGLDRAEAETRARELLARVRPILD